MLRTTGFWLVLVAAVAGCSPAGGGRRGSGGSPPDETSSTGTADDFDPTPDPPDAPAGSCTPGELGCHESASISCTDQAIWEVLEACGQDQVCSLGVCVGCVPFTRECRVGEDGLTQAWECVQTGVDSAEWQQIEVCPSGTTCTNGVCLNPCSSDIKLNTNQGCDYYAVDLENENNSYEEGELTGAFAQFAVVVANPNADFDLTVTVHETHVGEAVRTEVVQPKGLAIIELEPRNVEGTLQSDLAWRVKGDRPFVAYQFNPLDNVNPVYSNDASLLLPVNALGRDYVAMTASGGRPWVTIVGTAGGTNVTVTVTAITNPSDDGEIPVLYPGDTFTTSLGAGEVLNLRAPSQAFGPETLTGTTVSADRDVAVFGGNVLGFFGERCCGDHLEQQLVPTSAWGTSYVAARSKRRRAEVDHWRILARDDGTKVTFSAGVSNPVTLGAGEFVDVDADSDFAINATGPIQVAQFLAASQEILPLGEFCFSSADCASGACSSWSLCTPICIPTTVGCESHEYCISNAWFSAVAGVPASGGSCIAQRCGTTILSCGGDASCIPGETVSTCYDTCDGGCPVDTVCDPQSGLCAPSSCSSDFTCSDGYCVNGGCVTSCTPPGSCPGAGSVCLPPGFTNNPAQDTGHCSPETCASDADCGQGEVCATDSARPRCMPIGDPAFIIAVPTEQFRDDYTFLAPNAYEEDYVNVIAKPGTTVALDGAALDPAVFEAVHSSEYAVARLPLTDGPHRIVASEPVGIVVYGYDAYVSYGYPGGANLFDLGN